MSPLDGAEVTIGLHWQKTASLAVDPYPGTVQVRFEFEDQQVTVDAPPRGNLEFGSFDRDLTWRAVAIYVDGVEMPSPWWSFTVADPLWLTLEGFVVDAVTGEPIEGAEVTAWEPAMQWLWPDVLHTDSSGYFEFDAEPVVDTRGEAVVVVHRTGYHDFEGGPSFDSSLVTVEVTLEPFP